MGKHAQLSKLGLFDARVPRYTSYPTATQFSTDIGPDEATRWISAIPAASRVSLYVHIPFCRRLCWFCACRTQGTSTLSPVAAYVTSLKAELALIAKHLPAGVSLSHLHWGGGTPTLLSPELISELATAIFDQIPLGSDAQFSVEIDPSEIDDMRLDALCAAGMNRASVGVQDFDPLIQKTIGREQSFATTQQAIDGVRSRGIQSLNMDILYGLPHQSLSRMRDSVHKVVRLSPDRIALYGYAHVPWMAKRQQLIPSDALPTPQQRLALFETARDILVAAGYQQIGIDHFARPDDGLARAHAAGSMRRNFQGYTEDTSAVLIGLGASAISRFGAGYAQNAPATPAYQTAIRSGQLATSRGHEFGGEDLVRARLIEALMCDFSINYAKIADELGCDKDLLRALTAPLPAKYPGMLSHCAASLTVRPLARPLTRMIACELDAYEAAKTAHSHAI